MESSYRSRIGVITSFAIPILGIIHLLVVEPILVESFGSYPAQIATVITLVAIVTVVPAITLRVGSRFFLPYTGAYWTYDTESTVIFAIERGDTIQKVRADSELIEDSVSIFSEPAPGSEGVVDTQSPMAKDEVDTVTMVRTRVREVPGPVLNEVEI